MNPEEFFTFSCKITSEDPSELAEITFRSAINRIYYGIFHWIQRQYHIHIPAMQINRCHANVKEILASHVMSDDILEEYNFLEKKRVESDYFLDLKITKSEYETTLQSKERLVKLVEENPEFIGFFDDEIDLYKKRKQFKK